MRGHAYAQMLEDWVEGDPAAAGTWLQRLPAGQSRDAAVSTFARRVRDTDPVSAVEWANTISNAGERTASMDTVVHHWLSTNPNAARNWIASSRSLTEEARARYLERK